MPWQCTIGIRSICKREHRSNKNSALIPNVFECRILKCRFLMLICHWSFMQVYLWTSRLSSMADDFAWCDCGHSMPFLFRTYSRLQQVHGHRHRCEKRHGGGRVRSLDRNLGRGGGRGTVVTRHKPLENKQQERRAELEMGKFAYLCTSPNLIFL